MVVGGKREKEADTAAPPLRLPNKATQFTNFRYRKAGGR